MFCVILQFQFQIMGTQTKTEKQHKEKHVIDEQYFMTVVHP